MALPWRRLAHSKVIAYLFRLNIQKKSSEFIILVDDRNKWNIHVVPYVRYVPTFMDSWTPDASFFSDEKQDVHEHSNVRRLGIDWASVLNPIFKFKGKALTVCFFLLQTERTRYSSEFDDSDRADRRRESLFFCFCLHTWRNGARAAHDRDVVGAGRRRYDSAFVCRLA